MGSVFKFEIGGAPVFNWHEIRRRRKSEGGQKFLPPNPLPFCPPERLDFKIRNSNFRQKKFEHQSKNTADREAIEVRSPRGRARRAH